MPAAVRSRPDAEVGEVLWTFDELVRLSDEGWFDEDARLELIDGRIYDLAPVSDGHGYSQADVIIALHRHLGSVIAGLGARIVGNASIRIDPRNAPIFDAAVVRPTPDRFLVAADALLVVEIAVSSTTRDLREKPPLYARGAIPEYWVINRRTRKLHLFRRPEHGLYRDVPKALGSDDLVAAHFAPDVAIPVADLL